MQGSKFFSKITNIFLALCICSFASTAQSHIYILNGSIRDGITGLSLFGVSVAGDSASKNTLSTSDGHYTLLLNNSNENISYSLAGYQTKIISQARYERGQLLYLDIILYPCSKSKNKNNTNDSIENKTFDKEVKDVIYNSSWNNFGYFYRVGTVNKDAVTIKETHDLLKELNAVITRPNVSGKYSTLFNINGLGQNYNQVLLNGTILNSVDYFDRSYSTDLLPAGTIDNISIQKIPDGSMPADFAGGTIAIKMKDIPDSNFYSIQLGVHSYSGTSGKKFISDNGNSSEFLSFPGSKRSLPSEFPTTRSRNAFNEKNIQNQLYLSKQLNNNLNPDEKGNSSLNDKFSFRLGKIIKLKKGTTIGLTGFIAQEKNELIESSTVQSAPDVTNNPFPFDGKAVLIRTQSEDTNYSYYSQFCSGINGTIYFGKNKITLNTIYGSQFINVFTQRSAISKPGEDSLANSGINYKTEQRKFLNIQLSGEHALGLQSKLKLDWHARYSYYQLKNPDDRNFLLRQDSLDKNKFEISHQNGVADDITNSGRLWRSSKDHIFTGAFNLTFPFTLFKRTQVIAGGVYLQTKYRVFYSDLLLTKGTGYFSLDNLLDPENYYPGGLSVVNYYSNHPSYQNLNDRPNYTASATVGATYLSLENKFSDFLSLNWGVRVESNSQLVSSTQYNYFEGFRYPQISSLDQNVNVNKFSLLPTVNLKYTLQHIRLHAAWFRTVNRAELQQLSSYRYYDATSFTIKSGNPLLRNSTIDNYDAGINWAANAGIGISLSGFYKIIDQPIEDIVSSYSPSTILSMPNNTAPATVKGATLAVNVDLGSLSNSIFISGISFFANGTWCKTHVDEGPVKSTLTPFIPGHTLSGSPATSINAGLLFQKPHFPSVTILYNQTSDYIIAVGSGPVTLLSNGNKITAIPDYRVKGYAVFDLQLGQKLFKSKIAIIAGINNLFDNSYIEYQDLNGNKKFDEALVLTTLNGKPGFYKSGTDNTTRNIKNQRNFYLTLSYTFK